MKKLKNIFNNIKDKLKRFVVFAQTDRFRFFLGIAFLSISVILMLSRYFGSLERLWASMIDFGSAISYYFVDIFGDADDMYCSIVEIPQIDLRKYIWFDIDELINKFNQFPDLILNKFVFKEYNGFLFDSFVKLCVFLLNGLMLILVPILLKTVVLQKNDLDAAASSAPYRWFLKFLKNTVKPFFTWAVSCFKYIFDKKYIFYPLVIVWIININLPAIVFGAVGYYFYFLSSLDILSLFNQVVKLTIDVIIMLSGLPLFVWLIVAAIIFVLVVLFIGYNKLDHMESKNCGFLKTTSYISLIKGEPGLGKTTLATDMGLSWENIYKADSLEIMMSMDMLFPAFPFQKLRWDLNEAFENKTVFCPAASDPFLDKLLVEGIPYGYDTDIFPVERNIGTSCITLEKAIRIYSKAYFVYSNDNSTMANYPIRFDGKFDDSKHLKKWNGDFFRRHAIKDRDISRYAHILDQDVLRQGKKIDPKNKFNGTFGYGIYVNTEWGKSRGNQLTTEDVKKSDDTTNQKNDLYSYALKMCRHANSTIYHKVFFRFIGDEQRPESLSADQRELCSIIDIADKSELKLALPFGKLLDKIYESVYDPFIDFYTDYLNARSDIMLSVWLLKFAVSAFSRFYGYLYNTFGYYELTLALEKGSNYGKDGKESEVKTHIYYLMCKKIYSDRYNTDCHSAYFTKLQLEAGIGIKDYPTYNGLRMTVDEMKAQHDYFINEWLNIMNQGTAHSVKVNKKVKNEDVIASFDLSSMF